MRISARCDYACKALLELGLRWPEKRPVSIQVISEKQQIPERYLVQILIQLKKGKFLTSVRGKEGGYLLAKAPAEIHLGDVLSSLGEEFLPIAETAAKSNSAFSRIWEETEAVIAAHLDAITFADILAQQGSAKLVYHI